MFQSIEQSQHSVATDVPEIQLNHQSKGQKFGTTFKYLWSKVLAILVISHWPCTLNSYFFTFLFLNFVLCFCMSFTFRNIFLFDDLFTLLVCNSAGDKDKSVQQLSSGNHFVIKASSVEVKSPILYIVCVSSSHSLINQLFVLFLCQFYLAVKSGSQQHGDAFLWPHHRQF